MEFNANSCRLTAEHSYNELMAEKYKDIVNMIKTEANAGKFIVLVDNMPAECCKWLLQLNFKISLLEPNTLSNNKTDWCWHWINEPYYDEELQKYGYNGAKIEWKY